MFVASSLILLPSPVPRLSVGAIIGGAGLSTDTDLMVGLWGLRCRRKCRRGGLPHPVTPQLYKGWFPHYLRLGVSRVAAVVAAIIVAATTF